MAKHGLGDLEVGDYAVLEGTNGDNVTGGPAEHALGVVADGLDFIGAGLDRHHRGLAQDDAMTLDVDQGVGGPKVDSDIIGKKVSEEFFKHGSGSK